MSSQDEKTVALRHLAGDADYEQCLELQRLTWGRDFNELVPPAILMISQKVGGIAAGAFDDQERMLGFVFGISGVRDDRPAHWSHMLAVTPQARGLGLGKRLKLFQRRELLQLGIEVMYWTYDPLVARNANLNINRLGALPQQYVRDMYGDDTGSEVHSGLGTDRFIVAWELTGDQAEERLRRADEREVGDHERVVEEFGEERLLNPDGGVQASPPMIDVASSSQPVYVEIPWDIDAEKARSRGVAHTWRLSSRAAIERALAAGCRVSGFVFAPPVAGSTVRCFYRLERSGA